MDKEYPVKLHALAQELELTVVNRPADYDDTLIHVTAVNRPGLQLAGYYDYFDPRRLQIMGIVETTYLISLPPEERIKRQEAFLSRRPVAVVFCHGIAPLREFLLLAEEYGVPVLTSDEDTSETMSKAIDFLMRELAPRITRHGVLVEVHGEGLFIIGDSGIGKSETALELIKRGHRLIADDAVEIRRVDHTVLLGEAPELIRYYMELRGIGVIDVRQIFGVGAVKPSNTINLVVKLELWNKDKTYDRLGIFEEYTDILGVKVPMTTIPVHPGRNLAVIMEIAAMNHRQKRMGYNAAVQLSEMHDRMIERGGF